MSLLNLDVPKIEKICDWWADRMLNPVYSESNSAETGSWVDEWDRTLAKLADLPEHLKSSVVDVVYAATRQPRVPTSEQIRLFKVALFRILVALDRGINYIVWHGENHTLPIADWNVHFSVKHPKENRLWLHIDHNPQDIIAYACYLAETKVLDYCVHTSMVITHNEITCQIADKGEIAEL